jgi:hypothetical protein
MGEIRFRGIERGDERIPVIGRDEFDPWERKLISDAFRTKVCGVVENTTVIFGDRLRKRELPFHDDLIAVPIFRETIHRDERLADYVLRRFPLPALKENDRKPRFPVADVRFGIDDAGENDAFVATWMR